MTDQLAVTLTVDQLKDLIRAGVREVLEERAAVDDRARDLASEEMTTADVLALFHRKTPKTLTRWRKKYGFPAPREVGGRILYMRSEVDQWRATRAFSGSGARPLEISRKRRTEGRAATPTH